jgi:hypothetical protein
MTLLDTLEPPTVPKDNTGLVDSVPPKIGEGIELAAADNPFPASDNKFDTLDPKLLNALVTGSSNPAPD